MRLFISIGLLSLSLVLHKIVRPRAVMVLAVLLVYQHSYDLNLFVQLFYFTRGQFRCAAVAGDSLGPVFGIGKERGASTQVIRTFTDTTADLTQSGLGSGVSMV